MNIPVMLFAAGLGTRMGTLTKDRPKPLIKVAGKALIDHALEIAQIPEVSRRVVNLHYLPDQMTKHLSGQDVIISDECDRLLETGGGLRRALPLLGGSPVATMNTDAVWAGPNPLLQLLAGWRDEMEALLLVVPKAQVSGHLGAGDFDLLQDGRLLRAPEHIYTGVQIIRTDCFAEMTETTFSMNTVWDQIAERGGLYGSVYAGRWCDVGQASSIPLAEDMLNV